jgi:hypothetical protein
LIPKLHIETKSGAAFALITARVRAVDELKTSPNPTKDDMTAIDYANCGINNVIEHSLKLHPQLLVDRLRALARVHAQFADAYGDREVMRSELGLSDRLHGFANAVELGDYTIPDDFDVRREAFSCAAWLQELHPIMQDAIADRDDARTSCPGSSGGGRRVSSSNDLARALAVSNKALLRRR